MCNLVPAAPHLMARCLAVLDPYCSVCQSALIGQVSLSLEGRSWVVELGGVSYGSSDFGQVEAVGNILTGWEWSTRNPYDGPHHFL